MKLGTFNRASFMEHSDSVKCNDHKKSKASSKSALDRVKARRKKRFEKEQRVLHTGLGRDPRLK